jgi:type I restriction enzyme S subunit
MMRGWIKCRLGDVINLKRGFDLPERDRIDGIYPIVSSSGITGYHNKAMVKGPGVVTGRYGTIGEVFYIESDFWPLNTSLYVEDFKGNSKKYISHLLNIYISADQNAAGAVPGVNRNHLHKIKISLPPLPIQRKISAVLSAYDDLIENNNRRIAILEKMAEELYREWFVRLRFPGHEQVKIVKGVPEGWEVVELCKVAKEVSKSTKLGLHLENRLYLPIDLLQQKHFNPESHLGFEEAQSSLVTFNKGDILFGAMRPYLHKVCIAPFDGITRTTCFVLSPIETRYYSYLYLLLFQASSIEHATLICNGSDRPYVIWNKSFEKMPVFKPSREIVGKYDDIVRPLLTKISSSYFYIQNLKQTRDRLLSRLMSGKIDVGKLDIHFPASMQEEVAVSG